MPNASELARVEVERNPHSQLARDIHIERAQLVELLYNARMMLAASSVYVSAALRSAQAAGVKSHDLRVMQSLEDRINKFMAAGLFGDRGGEK
jgi:hypothetical protein